MRGLAQGHADSHAQSRRRPRDEDLWASHRPSPQPATCCRYIPGINEQERPSTLVPEQDAGTLPGGRRVLRTLRDLMPREPVAVNRGKSTVLEASAVEKDATRRSPASPRRRREGREPGRAGNYAIRRGARGARLEGPRQPARPWISRARVAPNACHDQGSATEGPVVVLQKVGTSRGHRRAT